MECSFDAIVLPKGAPVKTSDGAVVMCAIAVSELHGLVRLYPLTVDGNKSVSVWSKVVINARKSQRDNRRESWRVVGCEHVKQVECRNEKEDILNSCILRSGTVDPIAYQNERKSSICVVKSSGCMGFALVPRAESELSAFDYEETWIMTQDNYPLKPYLVWNSFQGSEHKTHLVAQEVYVGMSKNASCPARIFENMRLGDPDYEHWIILGNMKDRRNVWVAPHVHRLKKTAFRTRLNLPTQDGLSEGWPYLQQEECNAKDVGPQMTFAFITGGT